MRRVSLWLFIALVLVMAGCEPISVHAPFLATWSPDGMRVAFVPFPFEHSQDNVAFESGIWIQELRTGQSHNILALHDGPASLHPQWSPNNESLLFITVETVATDTLKKVNGQVPFSVWTIGTDGRNLHKVVDAFAGTEDDL